MRQETLKKNACGAQRGPTRYSPFAHTCHCTHIHTQIYKLAQSTASNVFRLYPGQTWPTRTENRLSAHNLCSFLIPSPCPLSLTRLIPFGFVTFSFWFFRFLSVNYIRRLFKYASPGNALTLPGIL